MAYTTINKSTDYFNTKLYTGTGSSNAITGVGFQPDWVWIKSRNTAEWHHVIDAVRGGTNVLFTNTANAEDPRSGTGKGHITSFDTDGFTTVDTAGNGTNISGSTYASWNWLASNTTASNTDGSITSTVSANTTSGFSIVSWTSSTGADTVGHGLGVTPKVVISKTRSVGNNWSVHTTIIDGSNDYLFLNTTGASGNSSYAVPTSSIFNFNYGSSTDFISYVFAEKKGFSKFGSYTGNGSSDGSFIFTGFKPAFLILKRYDSTNNWYMYNNKVNPYNETDRPLKADNSESESTIFGGNELDFLSNGFKLRDTLGATNASGGTYIYMAFAENPFTTSTGIPCTAR